MVLFHQELTDQVLAGAIEVHKEVGPGLLESAYEECLCYEMSQRGLAFQRQLPLPVVYKGVRLDCGYRLDIVVADKIILKLKSVEEITDLHKAQLLTYLRISKKKVGLLLNFNVPVLKDGIVRLVF